jgi:hypothetical protein
MLTKVGPAFSFLKLNGLSELIKPTLFKSQVLVCDQIQYCLQTLRGAESSTVEFSGSYQPLNQLPFPKSFKDAHVLHALAVESL